MTETSGNGDSSCSIDTSGEAITLDSMSVGFLSPLWDLGSNNRVEDANECTKYRCNEIRDSTPNQGESRSLMDEHKTSFRGRPVVVRAMSDQACVRLLFRVESRQMTNSYGLYETPSVALSTLIGTSSPFPTLSRSTNFWILPVAVSGNWSTKDQSFGVL